MSYIELAGRWESNHVWLSVPKKYRALFKRTFFVSLEKNSIRYREKYKGLDKTTKK